MQLFPGRPHPLGVHYDGMGANVAVYGGQAEAVELCLFEEGSETRLELPEMHGHVWHGHLPFVEPGQQYGFRVHGPFDRAKGLLYNPNKLLLDPYARAISGRVVDDDTLLAYVPGHPDTPSGLDSAGSVPRSVIVNPYFDWGNDSPPKVPITDTVIYEVHVKGATKLHPDIPEELRGTYIGLGHPAFVEHLQRLGVTAVELLPVHEHVNEPFLVEKGLVNYWGYNSIGYFAPDQRYATGHHPTSQVQEFRRMVQALHDAGIEVILDVVYNHTGEGNHLGPTLCFKGFDNRFYRWLPDDPGVYLDFTGCGNSLNMDHPFVLQMVMDSLRYWVTEMHVDGFRFDLAVTLARENYTPDRLSAFFDLIQQDPVLDQVKLIAEPWDVGVGGYMVGNFPPGWGEWNGKYRDCVRDYWRADSGVLPELATRIAGSSDLYTLEGRTPYASINFITAHDGFTLRDLVSYDAKHNEANKEDNRDGDQRQLVVELRRRGPDRRPRRERPPGPPATELPHHLAALARDPDAARRRRVRSHPAGQQQRLLPGQRDLVVRLVGPRRGPVLVHRRAHRPAQGAPRAAPAPVPHRHGDQRRSPRPGVVPARRRADGRRRLGQRGAVDRGLLQRRRHHRAGHERRGDRRQQLLLRHQLLLGARRVHPADRLRRRLGGGRRHVLHQRGHHRAAEGWRSRARRCPDDGGAEEAN